MKTVHHMCIRMKTVNHGHIRIKSVHHRHIRMKSVHHRCLSTCTILEQEYFQSCYLTQVEVLKLGMQFSLVVNNLTITQSCQSTNNIKALISTLKDKRLIKFQMINFDNNFVINTIKHSECIVMFTEIISMQLVQQ